MNNLNLRKSGILGYKDVIKDIKELSKINKLMIIVIGLISLILSFVDFNHFIDAKSNPSIWSIVNTLNSEKEFLGSMPKWIDATLYSFSGLASFTTIVNIILICNGKVSNYFWGLISGITLGLFSFDFGYTGDAQLNLLFNIPFQFLGWWLWTKNLDNNNELNVRKNNTYLICGISILCCIPLFAIFFFEVPALHELLVGSAYQYKNLYVQRSFDSLNTSLSITASVLMLLRFKEQWLLWIFFDINQLILFSGLNNVGMSNFTISINALIQSLFSLINCLWGSFLWFKKSK